MHNRNIMTCSLDFLKAGLHSPKVGWIWMWVLLFQRICHFALRNLLIWGFRSVYSILNLSRVRSKVDLAAESAHSFSLTPMWLGILYIIISLQIDIECNLLNSLIIWWFSSFLLLNDRQRIWEYDRCNMFALRNDVESKVYCTGFLC